MRKHEMYQGFSCHDEEIMKSVQDGESLPAHYCALIAISELTLTIIVVDIINFCSFKRALLANLKPSKEVTKQIRAIAILSATKSLVLAYVASFLTLCLVFIGKKTVGALRPMFLETCFGSRQGYINFCKEQTERSGSAGMALYINDFKCPSNSDKIEHARMSFPSGWLLNCCNFNQKDRLSNFKEKEQ